MTYLLGVESASQNPVTEGAICIEVPATNFAIATVPERLEQRRTASLCAKRNLAGLTENFENIIVRENYLHGMGRESFRNEIYPQSGADANSIRVVACVSKQGNNTIGSNKQFTSRSSRRTYPPRSCCSANVLIWLP